MTKHSKQQTETRRRLILCSSVLQLINARAASDILDCRESSTYEDVVLLLHQEIRGTQKQLINSLSKSIGYTIVYDFSEQVREISESRPIIKQSNKKSWRNVLLPYKSNIQNFRSTVETLITQIRCEIGTPDIILHRPDINRWERIILSGFRKNAEIYSIEDGLEPMLTGKRRNFSSLPELRLAIKRQVLDLANFSLSLMLTKDYYVSSLVYLDIHKGKLAKFSNLELPGHVCNSKEFISTVRKLFTESSIHKERTIIIIGSIIIDSRFSLTVEREIEIYNQIIEKIKVAHDVTNRSIWYKPHPRLSTEHLAKKIENLNCRVFPREENAIAEVELCNPNLKAVYSVGSSSLFYAKLLFGITSFWIDIRQEPAHYARHKLYHDISKSLGIPAVLP